MPKKPYGPENIKKLKNIIAHKQQGEVCTDDGNQTPVYEAT